MDHCEDLRGFCRAMVEAGYMPLDEYLRRYGEDVLSPAPLTFERRHGIKRRLVQLRLVPRFVPPKHTIGGTYDI